MLCRYSFFESFQIEDGEIFATVNQKDGMVIFHDDPEKYNSPFMLKTLEDQVSQISFYLKSRILFF